MVVAHWRRGSSLEIWRLTGDMEAHWRYMEAHWRYMEAHLRYGGSLEMWWLIGSASDIWAEVPG